MGIVDADARRALAITTATTTTITKTTTAMQKEQEVGQPGKVLAQHRGAAPVEVADVTTSGATVALIVGVAIGALLVVGAIVAIFIRFSRRRKRPNFEDIDLEDLNGYTSRSAPISRCGSSNKLEKCQSVCNYQGYQNPSPKPGVLVRSLTVDTIPDFKLPPERVQPRSQAELMAAGPNALHYQQANCLGLVQPDLYKSSGDEEESELPPSQSGRVWFSLLYDAAVEHLTVTLVKAKHLKGRGKSNSPRDPYVKVYLLPDERSCQQSKVRRKTLTPKFNETFIFPVSVTDLPNRTLRLSMYDLDKRKVRHSLGHVLVALGDVDLTRNETMWRDLEPASQNCAFLGEVNVSLTHVPNMEKLKVVVVRCRNLRKLDFDADTGMYVRVQLHHGHKVCKTKKTATQRGTCDPLFNESFSFTVSGKQLDAISITATVMTSVSTRLGGHDEEYGRIVIGPFLFARGEELMHWQEVLAQPRTSVARWHVLSSSPATSTSSE